MEIISIICISGVFKLVKNSRYYWGTKEDFKLTQKYYKENKIPIKKIQKGQYPLDIEGSLLCIDDWRLCIGLRYLTCQKISKNEVFHGILIHWILSGYATPPILTSNMMTPFAFEINLTKKSPPEELSDIEAEIYQELLEYEKGLLTSFFLKEWIDSTRSDKRAQNKKYSKLMNVYILECIERAQNWQEDISEKKSGFHYQRLTNRGINGYVTMVKKKEDFEKRVVPLMKEQYSFYLGMGGKYLPLPWEGQHLYAVSNFRYPDVELYEKSLNTNEMFPN